MNDVAVNCFLCACQREFMLLSRLFLSFSFLLFCTQFQFFLRGFTLLFTLPWHFQNKFDSHDKAHFGSWFSSVEKQPQPQPQQHNRAFWFPSVNSIWPQLDPNLYLFQILKVVSILINKSKSLKIKIIIKKRYIYRSTLLLSLLACCHVNKSLWPVLVGFSPSLLTATPLTLQLRLFFAAFLLMFSKFLCDMAMCQCHHGIWPTSKLAAVPVSSV